jgi:hypothetical protein
MQANLRQGNWKKAVKYWSYEGTEKRYGTTMGTCIFC